MGAAASQDIPGSLGKFAGLPTEIRLLIWRMARHPRDVEIVAGVERMPVPATPTSLSGDHARGATDMLRMTLAPTTRPPPVLQVNRESRYETLPSYHYVRFPIKGPDYMVSTPWFHFSPEIDTLRLVTWCRCHEGSAPRPDYWVGNVSPPSCHSIDGLVRALSMTHDRQFPLIHSIPLWDDDGPQARLSPPAQELPPELSWQSWTENLAHLSFDASLFLRLADFNNTRSLWSLNNTRMACEELALILERSATIRTCTITMASAPFSPDAPLFPLAGDSEVTQTYNVRAVRIARKPPAVVQEPKLQQDGAVLIYHDKRQSTPGSQDLAIFELVDQGQRMLFTRPVGGPTAIARRMSWLIRTAPGPRSWLRILEPINPNTAFRDSFSGDMKMLLTEWLLLESHTLKRRLAAVCHGICMPDYGF